MQPGAVEEHEFALFLPHDDVGHIVLQGLELADHVAEGAPRLQVLQRILKHAVEHAQAEGRVHQSFVVECGGGIAPALADFRVDPTANRVAKQPVFLGEDGLGHAQLLSMRYAFLECYSKTTREESRDDIDHCARHTLAAP